MNGRTLRSKRLRAALWYAVGGRCPNPMNNPGCRGELGDDWEADHTEPWKNTHRTNVHEMQALCRDCNRKKGSMSFRSHQRSLLETVRDMKRGVVSPRLILCDVTTGGGKSPLPIIAASELIPSMLDRICLLVPRLALQEQAEISAQATWLLNMLGRGPRDLEIRRADNTPDPSRGKIGYATTHQAVVANPKLHQDEFDRFRYGLVIDETHHLYEGSALERAIAPLVERAAVVILMTGTLERHDGKQISFLPYRRVTREENGRLIAGVEPDMTPTSEMLVIRYSRSMALAERAIRHLEFVQLNGPTIWVDKDKQQRFAELETAGNQSRDALWTALNTEFAQQLLDQCIHDPVTGWNARRAKWPGGKLLVVAPSIPLAREYLGWARKMGVVRAEIATSADTEDALMAIRRFKEPFTKSSALDALFTVGMAYEGLDVPEIINIAGLTHIRSAPWIYQMVSRGNRVCQEFGPWIEQNAVIYGPNDPLLTAIFDKLRKEQEPFIKDRESGPGGPGHDPGRDMNEIAPLWSQVVDERLSRLSDEESLDPYQVQVIKAEMAELGIAGSPIAVHTLLKKHGGGVVTASPRSAIAEPVIPPSIREKRLRQAIEKYARKYDAKNGMEFGWLNREISERFGWKKRENMSEDELRAVWGWINDQFGVGE